MKVAGFTFLLALVVYVGFAAMHSAIRSSRAATVVRSAPSNVDNRVLEPFHAVIVDGAFDVTLTQSSGSAADADADHTGTFQTVSPTIGSSSVALSGDADVLSRVKTTVENGVLHIFTTSGFSFDSGSVKAKITTSSLDSITVNGSGDLELKGMSGKALAIAVNGSSDVRATGKVDNLSVDISGSGQFSGADLVTDAAKVSISGSGDAEVNAVKQLTSNIAGSGDIKYKGTPAITQSIAGSGSVSRM